MEDRRCHLLHQLMNCLTVVLGECELLQMKAGLEDNRRLAIIHERAGYMAELIRHYDCPAEFESPGERFLKARPRSANSSLEQ
ncbi:MAG TPA: hypothetical protein VFU86_11155 [Terriglobales bacterium]|nr:hypothetical protein [Terriglobales bacterium]